MADKSGCAGENSASYHESLRRTMTHIAKTPEPPYYAVIFTKLQSDDVADYTETAARMEKLAAAQPGYLGFESAREGLVVHAVI